MTGPSEHLTNEDLRPTRLDERTWGTWNMAALWVGMSVCIPTYMLSASMIEAGMSWRLSLLAILLGNAIVLLPLIVNGYAGTRFGIPFPVYARAAYGHVGAHVPSLLRSLVACGWFGIQTWIGGLAIHALFGVIWPAWNDFGGSFEFMGYGAGHFAGFFLFWLMNVYFVLAGTESIRWLETLAAPFLILMGGALLVWAVTQVGGLGAALAQSDALAASRGGVGSGTGSASGSGSGSGFWLTVFLPWLTAMVGFWATLSLNIPDFTRFARSQRAQAVGQAVGLLVTMPLFSFVGLAVTSATVILYGEAIWNPVDLLARLAAEGGGVVLAMVSLGAIVIATLSTNIAANVVSPANSFSNLLPHRITFRAGGMIAALLGILIFPWKLLDLYQGWLITYSGLLGAVGGVMLVDFVFVRRMVLDVPALYSSDSEFGYGGSGVNGVAIVATAAGILTALLGLLVPSLAFLFEGAWFSATLVAGGVYAVLMRR